MVTGNYSINIKINSNGKSSHMARVIVGNYNETNKLLYIQNTLLEVLQTIIRFYKYSDYTLAEVNQSTGSFLPLHLFHPVVGQTEPITKETLFNYLMKQNDLTEEDTSAENAAYLLNTPFKNFLEFISEEVFVTFYLISKYVFTSDITTTYDLCSVPSREGKIEKNISNCIFDIHLIFN